ncbi:MAG: aspartyl protease family protein [Bacteroidia bacterium]
MKSFFKILIFVCSSLYAQASVSCDSLHKLVKRGDFFLLDEVLRSKPRLNVQDSLFFSAIRYQAFNLLDYAVADARKVLNEMKHPLPDTALLYMHELMAENAMKRYRYNEAKTWNNTILRRFDKILTAKHKTDVENNLNIAKALAHTLPQEMKRKTDCEIKYTFDKAGLMRVPVKTAGVAADFVFDTGANLSTVTESQAQKMKFRMLQGKIQVNTASGKFVEAGMAEADSLVLGDMVFYHVVFLVLRDKDLKFLGGFYKISGILGLPVIAQAGTVHIFQDGRIRFDESVAAGTRSNLALDGFTPMLEITVADERMVLIFDTGAAKSMLGSDFSARHVDLYTQGKRKPVRLGGAGGSRKMKAAALKNIAWAIGAKTGSFEQILAVDAQSDQHGYIGQDIFKGSTELVLDWKNMRMELR